MLQDFILKCYYFWAFLAGGCFPCLKSGNKKVLRAFAEILLDCVVSTPTRNEGEILTHGKFSSAGLLVRSFVMEISSIFLLAAFTPQKKIIIKSKNMRETGNANCEQ